MSLSVFAASILGAQLFALAFNALVGTAAAEAHHEAEAYQRLVTKDRVSRVLRDEYRIRYAQLVDNIVPLLTALSTAEHLDDELRSRSRTESRRLRALFDQATMFDHPLMRLLRPAVDAAEARQVDVPIDLAGELPELAPDQIATLIRPVECVLRECTASARVVLTGASGEISVSVVGVGVPDARALSSDLTDDDAKVVTSADTVWLRARASASNTASQVVDVDDAVLDSASDHGGLGGRRPADLGVLRPGPL